MIKLTQFIKKFNGSFGPPYICLSTNIKDAGQLSISTQYMLQNKADIKNM